MFSKIATRFAVLASSAIGLCGTAHASVMFTNLTGEPIRFSTSYAGATSTDVWVVDPHSSGSIYCRNRADRMQVTIVTSHGDGDEVVRSTVFDGSSYDLGYDHGGDMSITARRRSLDV